MQDGGGNQRAVQDDRQLAAAVGGVLRAMRDVVARELAHEGAALAVELEGHYGTSDLVAIDMRRNEIVARQLRLAAHVVRPIGAVFGLLKHEQIALRRTAEGTQARLVAGLLRDFVVVRHAAEALARRTGRIALRHLAGRHQLVDQLLVTRVRQAEFEVRGALQRTLRLGARGIVNARQLHEKAVPLHALDDGLVHSHPVHAAAHNFDDALVAARQRLLYLGVDGRRVVRVLNLGHHGLAKGLLVHAQREGRAALQIQTQADFLAQRRRHANGKDGNGQQNQPFPRIGTNR